MAMPIRESIWYLFPGLLWYRKTDMVFKKSCRARKGTENKKI